MYGYQLIARKYKEILLYYLFNQNSSLYLIWIGIIYAYKGFKNKDKGVHTSHTQTTVTRIQVNLYTKISVYEQPSQLVYKNFCIRTTKSQLVYKNFICIYNQMQFMSNIKYDNKYNKLSNIL